MSCVIVVIVDTKFEIITGISATNALFYACMIVGVSNDYFCLCVTLALCVAVYRSM